MTYYWVSPLTGCNQKIPLLVVRVRLFKQNLYNITIYLSVVRLSDVIPTIDSFSDSRHLLAYETVSLEERSNYSVQLSTLLNVIWKNVATLDTAAALKM